MAVDHLIASKHQLSAGHHPPGGGVCAALRLGIEGDGGAEAALRTASATASNSTRSRGDRRTPPPITTQSKLAEAPQ